MSAPRKRSRNPSHRSNITHEVLLKRDNFISVGKGMSMQSEFSTLDERDDENQRKSSDTTQPKSVMDYVKNMMKSSSSIAAILYVLSGVSQPLLMTVAKEAGLTDPRCQLYMLFYYFGPASVALTFCNSNNKYTASGDFPSSRLILKGCGIQCIDVFAQTLNYTGSILAGPTIFAIIYSSVTIWTAVLSRIFLSRSIVLMQWSAVAIVFGGLVLTSLNSAMVGAEVFKGSLYVIIGSIFHALMYVLSEALMTLGEERLTVTATCAIQGLTACTFLLFWQFFYTIPHWEDSIGLPMREAETTYFHAFKILVSLSLSNVVHAYTFFHTLKNFPGGATSAGVMKGLQAVLVFVVTSLIFCGRVGGLEMCFTRLKFLSLVVVVSGVGVFGKASDWASSTSTLSTPLASSPSSMFNKVGYTRVGSSEISSSTLTL